ncbi:prephenate dehydrogenase [Alienimonas chondri]|uniref:Cyclohexadienyl dehydrogenase n=1 Tax=Alienimonas chondri TaxID=2681879 RepID=A0ABX1V954_9PLAN|nr:prephenate dehydrogenase [Alienimonas chondri]NNJ24540.1 Cyclohexadienyl dehydrogenase [Alienimonas chondri]
MPVPSPSPPPVDSSSAGPAVRTLGVVGVGLIGGSIAAAALKRGAAKQVIGFGRDRARLEAAREAGLLTRTAVDPAEASSVDLLVVCTPVGRIAADIARYAPHLRSEACITDAGSVKQSIVDDLPDEPRFVPAHPLAGSEKSGWEHADADLFEGRVTVVCRTPSRERTATVAGFWQALGSRVEVLDACDHDARLARTSHLPHAMAAALCLAVDADSRENHGDGRLTSTGFADTTRVAAGDPGLWADIFHANAFPVRDAIDRLTDRLGELRSALTARDRDAIETWLADAANRRAELIGASLTHPGRTSAGQPFAGDLKGTN